MTQYASPPASLYYYYIINTFHLLCLCPEHIRVCIGGTCAGLLDAEMDAVTKRMTGVLHKLPQNITPVNLEELRRVKQQLVELESKADNLRRAAPSYLRNRNHAKQAVYSF